MIYQVEIEITNENKDHVYNCLYLNNISTILEENGKLTFFIDKQNLLILNDLKKLLVENYFSDSIKITVREFINKDWNKEWEQSIEPVYIKNKLIVYPSWKFNEVKNKQDKILIQIDPKMSFGTGHNETTQLILEMLCDFLTEDDNSLLDYGCGTAILAIASVKLGVNKAIAIDIDIDSILNAKEYINSNNVNNKILLYESDIDELEETDFDIICVNIIRNVIEEKLDAIYKKLKPYGKLFISGILKTELDSFNEYLILNKFQIEYYNYKSEWSGIYAQKIN
jgi:ribosomal protein L11 methyltransferase